MRPIALLVALAAPAPALACGGFFCNSAQPVTQAAERILFARDGGRMHMHVRLTWAGPPAEFGWLIPVPADVGTAVSSERLFRELDARFEPRFSMRTEYGPGCEPEPEYEEYWDAGAVADSGGEPAPPSVQVLSREPVGPYDRVILRAERVGDLLDWLEDNGFQAPRGAEARLQPYVEMGMVFLAIKLLPEAGSDEVVPLQLTFDARTPAIPIQPTAVAAEPDMGLIVHVLGAARAVPVNYDHVRINLAAIDWESGGRNYPDVVSQAADEAGGHAFATDFAGPHRDLRLEVFDAEALARARTLAEVADLVPVRDVDVARIVRGSIPPEFLDEDGQLRFEVDPAQVPIDGLAIAARLDAEINAPRRSLNNLFERHPYLTRLFTTLSPAEMDRDPIFDLNVDLPQVDNVHQAVREVPCADGAPDFENAVVRVEGGEVFGAPGADDLIRRQGGETVRGGRLPAAAVVERLMVAGPPEMISDRRGEIEVLTRPAEDGCRVAPTGQIGVLAGLLLLGVRRRRAA